jgi:hypothetical protein
MEAEQIADGWLLHDGGPECPIDRKRRTEALLKGEIGAILTTAGRINWARVTAYKPERPDHD